MYFFKVFAQKDLRVFFEIKNIDFMMIKNKVIIIFIMINHFYSTQNKYNTNH